MPRIQFTDLPREVWQHILERVEQRQIRLSELRLLQDWVKSEPTAPDGDWYKDFGSFKLCGTGQYPKTVLQRGMKAYGEQIW